MSVTFKNSPLVEIIAELRWRPSFVNIQSQPGSGFFVFGGNLIDIADQNMFFSELQTAFFNCGFPISERLVPPGAPALPYQVIQRYRNPNGATLLQAGPGVFTANAVHPYRSWREFEPTLKQGVEALSRVRRGSEKGAPFTSVSLRYINSFRARHLGGRTAPAFMRDVLGIYVKVPSIVAKHSGTEMPDGETMRLSFALSDGLTLALNVAEGLVNAEMGLILDLTVGTAGRDTEERDAVSVLAHAHDIIHDIFVHSIEPIRADLQPEDITACA